MQVNKHVPVQPASRPVVPQSEQSSALNKQRRIPHGPTLGGMTCGESKRKTGDNTGRACNDPRDQMFPRGRPSLVAPLRITTRATCEPVVGEHLTGQSRQSQRVEETEKNTEEAHGVECHRTQDRNTNGCTDRP